MTKIYTDTNRLIDFYRLALDKVDVLDELARYKGSLVFTRQTINEFHRNREASLNWLIAEFKKSVKVPPPYTTAILRSLPAHKELKSIRDDYEAKANGLSEYLRQLVEDESKDPIAQKVFALWADPAVTTLEMSDGLIDKAFRRKLLGNPPTSPDKYTVGDELIWEILLANIKENLVVVTKDRTFQDNQSLLKKEFSSRTGKTLILVTENFSSALETVGQTPSKKLIEAEKKLPDIKWAAKGSGRHANILWRKINDVIWAYVDEVELETGEDLGGDTHIIPIKRLVASLINRDCDETDTDIRNDPDIKRGRGKDTEG